MLSIAIALIELENSINKANDSRDLEPFGDNVVLLEKGSQWMSLIKAVCDPPRDA